MIEMLMSFYASVLSSKKERNIICLILSKACSIRPQALALVKGCGISAWLQAILDIDTVSKADSLKVGDQHYVF